MPFRSWLIWSMMIGPASWVSCWLWIRSLVRRADDKTCRMATSINDITATAIMTSTMVKPLVDFRRLFARANSRCPTDVIERALNQERYRLGLIVKCTRGGQPVIYFHWYLLRFWPRRFRYCFRLPLDRLAYRPRHLLPLLPHHRPEPKGSRLQFQSSRLTLLNA